MRLENCFVCFGELTDGVVMMLMGASLNEPSATL
jgi:hypothetical protein